MTRSRERCAWLASCGAILTSEPRRPLEGTHRHFQDTPRLLTDQCASPPPQSDYPDDLAARLEQRRARALPARDALVDQQRLHSALGRTAERNEAIATSAGSHDETFVQPVRVERGTVVRAGRRIVDRPIEAA